MKALARWFTDARRQAVQGALASLVPLIVLLGWISDDQAALLLTALGALLQLAQGLVGLALLRASEAAVWLGTTFRGLVYALAAAVGPLGAAFLLWDDAVAATILTVTGIALTTFSAVLQIVNVQTVPTLDGVPLSRREYRALLDPAE